MHSWFLLLVSPICWASWLNFKLLCRDWRFESFYVNYAWSIVAVTFGYGSWAAGSPGNFLGGLAGHDAISSCAAILAGVIWGAGNILLVAAVVLCGLAVGLKLAIGLSLVLGVLLTYAVNPGATHNPALLVLGTFVLALAILANSAVYKIRQESDAGGRHFKRGMVTALGCGVLIGIFPLFQGFAIRDGLNGAQLAFWLTVGDVIAAVFLLPFLMRHPIIPGDRPVRLFAEYRRARARWHVWAIMAGIVWSVGTLANLTVAVEDVGLSIAWAVGECSPVVGLLWGVLVLREFSFRSQATRQRVYRWLAVTFTLYLLGIALLYAASR